MAFWTRVDHHHFPHRNPVRSLNRSACSGLDDCFPNINIVKIFNITSVYSRESCCLPTRFRLQNSFVPLNFVGTFNKWSYVNLYTHPDRFLSSFYTVFDLRVFSRSRWLSSSSALCVVTYLCLTPTTAKHISDTMEPGKVNVSARNPVKLQFINSLRPRRDSFRSCLL